MGCSIDTAPMLTHSANSLYHETRDLSVPLTTIITQVGTPHQNYKTHLPYEVSSWMLEYAQFFILHVSSGLRYN